MEVKRFDRITIFINEYIKHLIDFREQNNSTVQLFAIFPIIIKTYITSGLLKMMIIRFLALGTLISIDGN